MSYLEATFRGTQDYDAQETRFGARDQTRASRVPGEYLNSYYISDTLGRYFYGYKITGLFLQLFQLYFMNRKVKKDK